MPLYMHQQSIYSTANILLLAQDLTIQAMYWVCPNQLMSVRVLFTNAIIFDLSRLQSAFRKHCGIDIV
jgi:hypothetical protein